MQKLNHPPRQAKGESRRAAERKRDLEKAPLRPEGLVPPAQYDHMRAPVWTQTLSAPARAGADDHKRHASRGF